MKMSFYGVNNNFNPGNDTFKFKYMAKELLPNTLKLRNEARAEHKALTEKRQRLLNNPDIEKDSSIIRELNSSIQKKLKDVEQFSLLATGFTREPEKELLLTLDDMAFLELEQEDL